jgi:acetylglutamate/LysW-gamma-L-alpha-aminoadipate kinase
VIICKIGGGERINLEGIAADIGSVEEPCVIVHGANALRDEIAGKMGYAKQVITSVKGYSSVFSDEDALNAILMAYSGLRNKRLVELCQQHGVNAVGLTGIDGRVIEGERNKGIRVVENGKKMVKRDLSGKPSSVNTALLRWLIDHGYTPVLTIPILDETGTAINTENDDVVCTLQEALDAQTVLQLIEAPGYMEDAGDPSSLVPRMTRAELMKHEEQVTGRMKRKMHALNKLARSGVERIIISDGRTGHPIKDALGGGGTWIQS